MIKIGIFLIPFKQMEEDGIFSYRKVYCFAYKIKAGIIGMGYIDIKEAVIHDYLPFARL